MQVYGVRGLSSVFHLLFLPPGLKLESWDLADTLDIIEVDMGFLLYVKVKTDFMPLVS